MRISTRFGPPLAALFALCLIPRAALATSEARDCPAEPTQNVPMASGMVYAGPNCTISPAADLDSFVFKANTGDNYSMAAAMSGSGYPNDICLALYDPNQKSVYSGCSYSLYGQLSIAKSLTLSVTGVYTIVITEAANNATIAYGLSLERIHPAPPDGRPVTLGQPVSDEINPLTDQDAFTFVGATTGTYRINASIASGGYPQNLCIQVYQPDGTGIPGQCTDSLYGNNSIQMDITPTQNGTLVVLVWEASWAGTIGYNLNVACLAGQCGSGPPCTLTDALTYDAASGTLTMNFTIGNKFSATWNAWLTYQNTMESLFSTAQPITDPPAAVTKTRANLPKSGKVGVLSTLTYPTKGITCSNWAQVDTGAP